MPDFGKTVNGACLQHDCQGENLTDTRYAQEALKRFAQLDLFQNHELDPGYLTTEEVNRLLGNFTTESQILLSGQERRDMIFTELFHLVPAQAAATVAADNPLQAVDERCSQPYQMATLSQKITKGPVRLGIDMPLRQDAKPGHVCQPEGVMLVILSPLYCCMAAGFASKTL